MNEVIPEIDNNLEEYCKKIREIDIEKEELMELKHLQDKCFKLVRELSKKIKSIE